MVTLIATGNHEKTQLEKKKKDMQEKVEPKGQQRTNYTAHLGGR